MNPAHVLFVTGTVLAALPSAAIADLNPANLRCEYQINPLGIDEPRPRLSWMLESTQRGQTQTAYQVLVAGSPDKLAADTGDLWDSGEVKSSQSVGAEYAGKSLQSGQRVWWKVRAWDKDGRPSAYSQSAWWEMALLSPKDWTGAWICRQEPVPMGDEDYYDENPAPLLRKSFTLKGKVRKARAYVSGLGYCELHLNGRKVGDHLLDPGWTAYGKRVLYSTYDVTDLLRPGHNAVGAILGNGWYNPLPLRMWGTINPREHLTVGRPRLILQLNIEYEDGSRDAVVTDLTWKVGDGPIRRNSIYLGEIYDARREQPLWDSPGFDEVVWAPAVAAKGTLGPLQAQTCPPIRATRKVKPVKLTEPRPGVFIFDMGQNFAGWVTMTVKAPAGTAVKLRYGELLYPDGTLNAMTSVCGQIKAPGLGGPGAPDVAYQSDTYIVKGGAPERYTPRFTFHGFRYVEITGLPSPPSLDMLEGHALNSDVATVGTFACSNELFNRIQKLIVWTQLSNMFSVQSDCPHRERFGYGGDILACGETAMLNFDMSRFYAKTVRDLQDSVRPNGGFTETAPFVGIADSGFGEGSGPIEWGTAHPLLLWQLYQYYGDRRLMAEQYDTAKRWIELLQSKAVDHIIDNGLGDHETLVPKVIPLTGTAFYYYNVHLMSQIARILGKDTDADAYEQLAGQIKAAFNARFLNAQTGVYATGTQCCQSTALYMNLVPEQSRKAVLDALVNDITTTHNGHLSTGIFGTRFMLMALSDLGRADVAYTIANQKTFPGWGHMLENGATTLWEHWEFSDNVFSHNHPMFGSVGEWFIKYLAGIRPTPRAVGFDKIILRPCPADDLTWARGHYDSIRGRIVSDWKIDNGDFRWNVTIPPNMTAMVHVPARSPESVTEGREPAAGADGVRFLGTTERAAVYQIGSGSYVFVSKGFRKGD
jgi:alpha-L-rhamnosidase